MGIIDFMIIVIGAWSIAKGLTTGLVKQIPGCMRIVAAVALSSLYIGPLAGVLTGTALHPLIASKAETLLSTRFPALSAPFAGSGDLTTTLSEAGLPAFLARLFSRFDPAVSLEATMAETLAGAAADAVIRAAGFLCLFVVFMLAIRLVFRLLAEVMSAGGLGWLDTLGGAVFSLARAVILLTLLLMILGIVSMFFPAVGNFIANDLARGTFSPGRYLYYENPLRDYLLSLFK